MTIAVVNPIFPIKFSENIRLFFQKAWRISFRKDDSWSHVMFIPTYLCLFEPHDGHKLFPLYFQLYLSLFLLCFKLIFKFKCLFVYFLVYYLVSLSYLSLMSFFHFFTFQLWNQLIPFWLNFSYYLLDFFGNYRQKANLNFSVDIKWFVKSNHFNHFDIFDDFGSNLGWNIKIFR